MNPTLSSHHVHVWQPLLFGALAGGMAWGIRGQYGHETGAMLAGLLIGLVMLLLFCPRATSLNAARAVAWCTVAIGIGGAETYGQTIGLTQNASNIGNWNALAWGMTGLALKGAIWIGFGGAFLGLGLSALRYRSIELTAVVLGLLMLFVLGVWLLNTPFDPARGELPKIYFSATALEQKPRREVWGGLLFALLGLLTYLGWVRRDQLAVRLGGWAMVGGAIGFPLGQCLQAYHAWNKDLFRQGAWAQLDPLLNWWNLMETTFGAVAGATIGLGIFLNRRLIASLEKPRAVTIPLRWEWLFAFVHVFLLMTSEFQLWHPARGYAEFSLVLALIPIVAVAGGRWWPYLIIFPITLLPIATKTVQNLAYKQDVLSPALAWSIYMGLPLLLSLAALFYFASRWTERASPFLAVTLIVTAWTYFCLNYAFFRFPWPWAKWTLRTPNALIYLLCLLGLTTLGVISLRRLANGKWMTRRTENNAL